MSASVSSNATASGLSTFFGVISVGFDSPFAGIAANNGGSPESPKIWRGAGESKRQPKWRRDLRICFRHSVSDVDIAANVVLHVDQLITTTSRHLIHYNFVRIDFVSGVSARCAAKRTRHHHGILTRNLLRMLFPYQRCVVSIVSRSPAITLDLFEGESNMSKKLLGVAAMAAVVFAVAPASAAKMMAGCSGDNLMKVETMVEAMPDGETKMMGWKEITAAQAALLDGHMAVCGAHLSRAAHAGMMK